jgi:uncharacterized protein YneF (UPF0154 family)
MNGKKIAIIIISVLTLGGIGYFVYRRIMYKSGNPDKDNRRIRIFRTDND